jgi:hypothetical protein
VNADKRWSDNAYTGGQQRDRYQPVAESIGQTKLVRQEPALVGVIRIMVGKPEFEEAVRGSESCKRAVGSRKTKCTSRNTMLEEI